MAAKTREELRTLVRTQLDMEADELPDTTLDPWFDDGFNRTINREERWPFLEHSWTITTVDGQTDYSLASLAAADADGYEVLHIASLVDITDSNPLTLQGIAHDVAESTFSSISSSVPAYWSEWGGNVSVWPAPEAGRTIRVRGYRKAVWEDGDDVAPDCDSRLHYALYYFGVAQAYAQQEDDGFHDRYMREWQASVEAAHEAIMAAPLRRPIIMSGSSPSPWVSVRLVP